MGSVPLLKPGRLAGWIAEQKLPGSVAAPCIRAPLHHSHVAAGKNVRTPSAQGDAVTGGLRKVTDDMKTKNRASRFARLPPPLQ